MSHRLLPNRPERYHGKESSRPYFEGWYFKQASNKGAVSVIAGVFRTENKTDDTAFIQMLLGSGKSYYFSYAFEDFSTKTDEFEVWIGDSFFSMERVVLSIDQGGTKVEAQIRFSDIVPLKTHVLSPSIMGPFSYLPKMQCNHGVLSLTHRCDGVLKIDGEEFRLDGARGYIEKDWGEAFPSRWVWMQCNDEDVSLMCSIATIPYGAVNLTGLICVLLVGTKQYRFASYSGARVISIKKDEDALAVMIRRGKYRLDIKTTSAVFGKLVAPTKTGMDRQIEESLDAIFDIKLTSKGKTVYSGTLENGGLEMLEADELAKAKA